MRKQEFLDALRKKLSGLPKLDVEERLAFYGESIDDRVEEGCTEEDAVATLGSVEEIAAEILGEIPLFKLAKERIRPKRRMRAWEIVFLSLGAPIWLSLAVAAIAVILSLYVSLWSVVVSLWSVFAALVACALSGAFVCVGLAATGSGATGLAMLAAGLVCAGLAIFLFFGCLAATKGAVWLAKKILLGMKLCFLGKEET
ncbi:MAG: DUF1700 domain-containing protein [Clostridia bacterium]|nr:DUF1700 domain-containing protein [Clostridia bacterium]